MKPFTDNQRHAWNLTIDVPTIRRVREELEIDLGNLDGQLLQRIGEDPVLLVDLLWVLVRPQAEALKVTDEEFGRGLAGEAIAQATDALLGAVLEFLPSRKRKLLDEALKKLRALEELTTAKGVEVLESDAIDRRVLDKIDRDVGAVLDRIAPTRHASPTA